MDKGLSLDFVGVTERAALASAKWIGKGDKHAADKAATEAMRESFNKLSMDGTIVIGEGEQAAVHIVNAEIYWMGEVDRT